MELLINDPKQRQASENFALKAYGHIKSNRAYALNDESKNTLAILGTALLQKRKAEGRQDMDGSPSGQKEMVNLLMKLNDAGVNLCQRRASAPKALPKPWINPITDEPLPPPATLDERALLAKQDPELLQWFDDMAKAPYQRLVAHNAAEAQRKVIEAIEYGPDQHNPVLNPFIPDADGKTNLTARSNFEKSVSPELLAFYKWEALPVSIPLFGANRDLTLEGRLSKESDVWAIMELGRSIHRSWAYDDKLAAEAARKAAEETLRKLAVA
jgi:hypothetical protein